MKIGEKAVDFKLEASNGEIVSLEDYRGEKNVVLYFYPKNNTPGWNTEASEFRDLNEEFEKHHTVIIGVSPDSMDSHHKFIKKFDLPFLLISDEDKELAKTYDVYRMKNVFGKEVMGIERSTFIIDKEGRLVEEYRKVRPKGHAEKVLGFVKENLTD